MDACLDKPIKASFCLKSYNQKQYVIPALRAAFMQDYSPLEIIVVDDCSNDGSDEILRKMIGDYLIQGGKHEVKYIRHKKNAGVIKTFEAAVYASTGDIIIEADGDDISLPCRVSQTVATWIKYQCKPLALYCNGYKFSGKKILDGEIGQKSYTWPLGAASAYARSLFNIYKPLPDDLDSYQDRPWGMRAAIASGFASDCWIDEKLIFYRMGGVSTALANKRRTKSLKKSLAGALFAKDELYKCDNATKELSSYKEIVSENNNVIQAFQTELARLTDRQQLVKRVGEKWKQLKEWRTLQLGLATSLYALVRRIADLLVAVFPVDCGESFWAFLRIRVKTTCQSLRCNLPLDVKRFFDTVREH